MTRKVITSKDTADLLVKLESIAVKRGDRKSFRNAWIRMWRALQERPLPPDETDEVFGEIRYRTKHSPRHAVCVAAFRPLVLQFAVCEEPVEIQGEVVELVTIVKALLMS